MQAREQSDLRGVTRDRQHAVVGRPSHQLGYLLVQKRGQALLRSGAGTASLLLGSSRGTDDE